MESPLIRQQRLGRILELPVEQVEAFIVANISFCTNRERTAVFGYYGIEQDCVTLTSLCTELGVTRARVREILDRGQYKLRIMASADRAPADPLEHNTEQFFNPRRAHEVGVPEGVWIHLLRRLSAKFPKTDDYIFGSPKMTLVVQMTEQETPRHGIGDVTLDAMKAMLATAGLSLEMELDPNIYK